MTPQSPYSDFKYSLVSKCPMCGASAQRAQIDMIGENEEGSMLLYSRCGSCGIGLLACLSGIQQGMFGAAILTDLQKKEISHFAETESLSADEVMEFAHSLRSKKKNHKK